MWLHFILENIHFAINLFAALTFFAVFWLYIDAWEERKSAHILGKIVGYLLLSLSFLLSGLEVESTIVAVPIFGEAIRTMLLSGVRILAYLFLIAGVASEPLEPLPTRPANTVAVFLGITG